MKMEESTNIIYEGKAKIFYPKEWLKKLSSKLDVFYNPKMRINRDFTIILVKIHSELLGRKLDILDSMAGTGIRSIRLLLEAQDSIEDIAIVDNNPKAIENIKRNLELNGLHNVEPIKRDCRIVMLEQKFEYIDIDPFGSPVGFIQPAVLSLKNKGLLGVTATDISALSGSRHKACFRKYSCIGIKTDFYLEFGLRVLAKYIIEEGLKFDIALKPVFGYYYLHHYRVFFVKSKKSKDIDYLIDNVKYIYYCPKCHYKSLENKCKVCGRSMRMLGPIYIGKIWEETYMEKIKNLINDFSEETKKVFNKIYSGDYKIDTWYYYDIPKIAKFLGIKQIPKLNLILEKFNAYRTHFSNLGIKSKVYPDLRIISK